ncbi:MAG: AraC family transcriptional regulator, partial [Lachnospiraceae bacterium]|nr:AraC family transcriptional regulator [Lachnospiraceae bacterium]
PITEIAFRCGFPDSNYFSTVFKRITQLAPSQYASYSRKHKIK